MTVFAHLPTEAGGEMSALRTFLAGLFERGLVSAMLVPAETGDGRSALPAVISEPSRLEIANPLLPVLPISGARMLSLLTRRLAGQADGSHQIAAVLRPCELRAVVELAKLHQVHLDEVLTIGIDCIGTVEPVVFKEVPEPARLANAILEAAREGRPLEPDGVSYRPACAICETPAPWDADISLHLVGVSPGEGLLVEVSDETLLDSLGLEAGADPAPHHQAVRSLIVERQDARLEKLDAVEAQMQANDLPGLTAVFETCQRCLNCTVACPICYCKECLFRTDVFDHAPETYLGWARRKGAARLPGDAASFHLTRLLHVSISCVGCGMCTSACPAGLPVDAVFQSVARRTQALFDYVPGRDPSEPLPLAAFRQDEFAALGNSEH